MTSRKRKHNSTFITDDSRKLGSNGSSKKRMTRKKRRQNILEKLESRQLLAGPQLIGVQPNEGELIVNGSVLDTAPRVLTLRFDQDQQLNPATFDGIRLTRAGADGLLNTTDDVRIVPGLITSGQPNQNEVLVRFSETLPDDRYKLEVFGFDDPGLNIIGLRNRNGELFQPRNSRLRSQVTEFDLQLGALIESIVPQPVIRLDNGSLVQNRNEIVVYFNEDPLFLEDDSAQGTISIGGNQITVNGQLTSRDYTDTTISFTLDNTLGAPTAAHNPTAATIVVSYPSTATFSEVASAIDGLSLFDASVTAGNAGDTFAAPAGASFLVTGNPTARSVENPRFYTLFLTQDTVRTTDDAIFQPEKVIYDPVSHTARLFFATDINELVPTVALNPVDATNPDDAKTRQPVPISGGTFRLRIGTAVDQRVDVILPPVQRPVAASVTSDFGIAGLRVTFTSKLIGESASGRNVRFQDSGAGGLSVGLGTGGTVVFDLGGAAATVGDLRSVVQATPAVDAVVSVSFSFNGVSDDGSTLLVPARLIGAPALTMTAVGDTLGTALDVGTFSADSRLTSLVFQESIDPKTFLIELPGGNDDPGHIAIPEIAGNLLQHISDQFGADTTNGVTDIAYNFAGIFDTDAQGRDFLNQITSRQKDRIREALGLWSRKIGVQFRETANEGITFALGNINSLQTRAGIDPIPQPELNARLRIDPTFANSAMVFSNQVAYGLNYGEDFLRKAMAGIGLILGLETTPDLPIQTLMALNPQFLNDTIDHTDPLPPFLDFQNILPAQASLRDLEPSFPGNFDIVHGNYLHRSDSIDVDLFRFEVDLDQNRVGTLTAETFAERLPNSSLLDTTLTLFQEQRASVLTDFGVGTTLSVRIDSLLEGRLGNNSRIDFIQTDRAGGDTTVRISQPLDSAGNPIANGLLVDIPRRGGSITSVPVGDVINAINDHPFASSIFRAALVKGSASEDIGRADLSFSPLLLSGGGLVQLSRNDDYFSEDSRIITQLGTGVYYIGVAASGNDRYDPTIADSSYGGRTQGQYELHLKFEPQVDKDDVIRDLDNPRVDVPGTPLDGDSDGVPGGVRNFWFQTRPLNRIVDFTETGSAITAGQTLTVTSGSGIVRRYEFVPIGGTPRAGNTAVFYNPGTTGFPTPAAVLASALQSAINGRTAETGVSVSTSGTSVIFTGERSVSVSSTFRGAEVLGRNIFVDKTAGPQADGSLRRPFNNIANTAVPNAFGSARFGDIVRIVGNGGADGDITTPAENFAYLIGVADTGGGSLEDGRTMEVPNGVTTMIDAGAAFKLRNARIGVGSSSVQLDRSNGALQVLGTPRIVKLSPQGAPVETEVIGGRNVPTSVGFDDGKVIFTSSRDRTVDTQSSGINPPPAPGNWGGLVFRRDVDQAEGRRDLEDEGIFLQSVNHADIRYGGTGNLLIDSVQQTVNPIQIINLRPSISFNELSFSADAAISAAPNSFEETSFQSPVYQVNGSFTADYSRVGPDIFRNQLVNNSLNGLFIRSTITPVSPASPVTTTVRFDDTSIVHAIAENLVVAGKPGGSISDGFSPRLTSVTGRSLPGGGLQAGDYQYRMTFVDADGFESLSTTAADALNITVSDDDSSVELIGLPAVGRSDYVARRLYRADVTAGVTPVFKLVLELDASARRAIDDGTELGGILDVNATGTRGRLNGSLVFDPNIVVKLQGARIELGQGAQLLAEGTKRNPVVFTSALDDRFGAGGTFDTNNDNDLDTLPAVPNRGDWSGIYGAPGSSISIDNGILAFAGGISLIGAESKGFAPIELQQAEGRITNTRFEFNDDGQDGSAAIGRDGRLGITPSTIFVRGAQPIIVGNSFIDNRGAIIAIDHDSFIADYVQDPGRQTGSSNRLTDLDDNQGPLIRNNRYANVASSDPNEQQLSGLDIRGGVITTETVFDDTDIVHVITDTLEVGNFHSSGGLLLKSRPEESLVVKLFGGRLQQQVHVGTAGGTANSPTYGTGITATGTPSSIADRIGGTVHILGLPGAPVVMTSLKDDTVGAGLAPDGSQFTDTNGDGFGSRPEPNDWRSILLDQWSNDRNVDITLEQELSTAVAPGFNSTTENAQVLGDLAKSLDEGDDTRRLGFEVIGFLSGPTDVDVYSFVGSPGTNVWVDIDKTTFQLDTVIELLDVSGNVLGRSDNSFAEIAGTQQVLNLNPENGNVGTLKSKADEFTDFGAGGLYEDFNSTNPRDAGVRFTLPGTQSNLDSRSVYFFRVRSASVNPDDASGGLTGGSYRFQVRLGEEQEFPGSVVRFADIRYANNGIHVRGLPGESPLLGDAQENEGQEDPAGLNNATPLGAGVPLNDEIVTTYSVFSSEVPVGQRPQYLGNLVNNKKNVISVGGSLETPQDVDFFQVDLNFGQAAELYQSVVFDIDYADGSRPDTNLSVFHDPDGEVGPEKPRLVLFGQNANIAEDRVGPLGEESEIERLMRGSVGDGDAFIGPVSLPEGSYYVAVSESQSLPEELTNNPLVRREPVHSVRRIFEDRIDAAAPSTPSGPMFPEMFSNAAIAASGFVTTLNRSEELGHGLQWSFDHSTATPEPVETLYAEGTVPLPFDIGNNLAGSLNLDTLDWSVKENYEIGGAVQTGPLANGEPENTSNFIPHVSVDANVVGDAGDVYQFIVREDGTRVIVDVDRGHHVFPLPPPPLGDPNSIDLDMQFIELTPTGPALLGGRITTSDPADGRGGSAATSDLLTTSLDPFFDGTLDRGIYWVAIVPSSTSVTISNGELVLSGSAVSGTYRAHFSMEDHPLVDRPIDNESLFFQRRPLGNGRLTSESFDLTGYAPDDQPRFYFNYLLNSNIGDAVSYTVVSDQDPVGITLDDLVGDAQWRQSIVPLNQFAGHTGVQVTFNYNSGFSPGGEGLYLDDFIVGFAERGETVFNARGDQDAFSLGIDGNSGEYQLEVRTATNFGVADGDLLGSNQLLVADFDTNDRHAQQITLVTPRHDQIQDEDTFTISDGAVTLRFEFDFNNRSSFSNIPISISATEIANFIASGRSTSILVAEKIRDAINLSTELDVEAASASGIDSGSMSDNRLNLFGAVAGSVLGIATTADAPATLSVNADGDLLMPAILNNGLGDSNYRRIQSQVIIENNVISDVNAIGIWSDPGDRDVDPEDLREDPRFFPEPFEKLPIEVPHPLLQLPPVGNVYPGAVRNLPTLNDAVIGGLAPGVVIRNNTLDQAGLAGIKVSGETRPFVLDGFDGFAVPEPPLPPLCDGLAMAIDSGGTRVVFEFEDIGGAGTAACGSGVLGGDGFTDGHVPIFYGHRSSALPYTSVQLALAIQKAIQGSVLVTNDMAELVTAYVGPSPNIRAEFIERSLTSPAQFPTAAVYLDGVSNIYYTDAFAKAIGGFRPLTTLAPVGDAFQPVARIVNNTVYGADGIESSFVGNPLNESNDLIQEAVVTHVGRAHTGPFRATAEIGDIDPGFITPENDVDFYRVELGVGDRLIVDIDTVAGGPDTSLRVFDASGVPQIVDRIAGTTSSVNTQATAPGYLDPAGAADVNNGIDPFIDFTALKSGTYYVAVSGDGNHEYDPNDLSGRVGAVGGTGTYDIGIEVYAPRQVVMSINGGRGTTGTRGSALIGTTFTVKQIPDVVFEPGSPYAGAQTTGNQITFQFSAGGGLLVGGNINIPIAPGDTVPEIMQAISDAVNGFQNVAEALDFPTIPNYEAGNGPGGFSGPIHRGRAIALGGQEGENQGIVNLLADSSPFHSGTYSSELYVLFQNIAEIELSAGARAAGLTLTPDAAKPQFAQNSDQLVAEAGIWVTTGASPTLLNNVIANAHQSVLIDETNERGFGKRVSVFGDQFVKPQEVFLTGTAFQHDEERNNEIRSDGHWTIETSLSTDDVIGATNVADQSDDFNFVVANTAPLFVNAEGNNFLPNRSVLIDSAINAVDERDSLLLVKNAVGIPDSNVLSPARDVRGVLRQDNPNFATPGALGFSVFKDRGSNELADFVGPFATTEVPRDNDAEGIDVDPSVGFINLRGGVLEEFRIQLRDTGDESDPFAGFGVDDRTVVVPSIPGLRPSGANLTLFENDILLTEGVDYTFNYDQTKNIITLTPLAGLWQNDRSYRIALNNQDRTVLVAPDPSLITDGDQLFITDSGGGRLVFEFEFGYSLLVPEPITMVIPRVGTNAGGLRDGDIFQIDDGQNPVVVFEFDRDGTTLPGTVVIPLPTRQTPTVESDLRDFLDEIAQNIADAVQTQIDLGAIDADVRVLKTEPGSNGRDTPEVVVGAEPGTTLNTTVSGLQQKPRALALKVPATGTGVGGVQDGETFVVSNGVQSATFEFDTGNGLNNNTNVAVSIPGALSGPEVSQAIVDAIDGIGLGLNPKIEAGGLAVYLNLPLQGSARVVNSRVALVGLSRTATDGDLIIVTPNNGDPSVTLEINRLDEPSPIGPINDGVTAPNLAININRTTTADQLARLIQSAIPSDIAGLNNATQVIDGGILAIGGDEGLGLNVTGTSLEVTGSPSVTASSTIEVLGPLVLSLPLVGGGGIADGSVLVLTDNNGNDVIFEFNENSTFPSVFGAVVVPYDFFSTADVIATNLVTAINAANIGITAQLTGALGQVSLGRIDESRVNLNGTRDPNNPFRFLPGLPTASTRRGIVSDGEILSITQGTTTVRFEFEAAIGGGGVQFGNVAVPFQPGSTSGDVAIALAAAIKNNKGNLNVDPVAELDVNGDPTGRVQLRDQPGTIVDVVLAPTLNVLGVPGGATPIRISADFGPTQVKQALIAAINSINKQGQPPVTTLRAVDRGGATFFVSNGVNFEGSVENFALPAITDLAGNPLEANRPDLSTQFTILMPTVGLDFGDAPDPRNDVPGRYPTLNASNGPRHVVSDGLALGFFVDADIDGVPGTEANGDDRVIEISDDGGLFATSLVENVTISEFRIDGETVKLIRNKPADQSVNEVSVVADLAAQIVVDTTNFNPLTRDGDLIRINTNVSSAIFEFDINGRFDEDHFAIRPLDRTSAESIAQAIAEAIESSPLSFASLTVVGNTVLINADDEDGVRLTSETNPAGVLNRGVALPIEVSVTGAGVLEAWIDFNADGDWNDPGEQIIPMPDNATYDALRSQLCPPGLTDTEINTFFDDTGPGNAFAREYCIVVPPTTPVPAGPITTYARFRISREGGLGPDGLALSGEVEDYPLTLLPGLPPQISQPNRSYTVNEDNELQARDQSGGLTGNLNDDGLLSTVTDPDGDNIAIYSEDVGQRTLVTSTGEVAGTLNVYADGTFDFQPTENFNGVTNFSVRVTDIQPLDPSTQLVNSRPISVTINVLPVNDRPEAVAPPVTLTREIDEDDQQIFSIFDVGAVEGLIGDKFVPGPANESTQALIIQSAGSSEGQFLTSQGGTLSIIDNGQTIVYTPPADYNGPDPDTFTYVVADVPPAGQLSEAATELGTVTITFRAVNDPPRAADDSYLATEDEPRDIPVNGDPNDPTSIGILDNDTPGPQDEIDANQTISLVAGQFPKPTVQGGTVTISTDGNTLTYSPPPLFSGVDTFTYDVVDNLGAVSSGRVTMRVGGVNNAPQFVGINGNANRTSIVRDEAKVQPEQEIYDLSTWFVDPEGDAIQFAVASNNNAVVTAQQVNGILTLTYPSFGFGSAILTVTATDSNGAANQVQIPVTVNNTPDPPSKIGTLNPLRGTEDLPVTADLTTVFFDPDRQPLQYQLARLGNIINPTDAQIAAHPLIQSVRFVGDQLRITLKPDRSGSVNLEVAASDGSFRVSDPFTLIVDAVADDPIARPDQYGVAIGSQLQIVNPANGLLNNDSDADGDSIQVDLTTIAPPTLGTLQVNLDGTFTYVNTSGTLGDVDSFRYRVIEVGSTGRQSNEVTVTLTLERSRYQNPINRFDVTADGKVSAVDALRVVNAIARNNNQDIKVSDIPTAPPDFLDVSGNGIVSAVDALQVINQLARVSEGEGEWMGLAASSVTTSFVSGSSMNLPSRHVELVTESLGEGESLDAVLAAGFEIASVNTETSVSWIAGENAGTSAASDADVDAALSQFLDDDDLNGGLH